MLEKLKEIMEEKLNLDTAEITPETRFAEDLEIDSLDLFEIVMTIEEEFDMEIPAEDLKDMLCVGDVITYIQRKKQ